MNKNRLLITSVLALGLASPALLASERPVAPQAMVAAISPAVVAISPLASSASLPASAVVVTPALNRETGLRTEQPAAPSTGSPTILASPDAVAEARPMAAAMQLSALSSGSSRPAFRAADSMTAVASSGSDGRMPSTATGLAAVLLMICILVNRRSRYGN